MRVFERTTLLVFGLASIFVIAVYAYAIIDTAHYLERYRNAEDGWGYVLDLKSLQINLLKEESVQQAYALTGKTKFFGQYHVYRKELEQILTQLAVRAREIGSGNDIAELKRHIHDLFSRMDKLNEASHGDSTPAYNSAQKRNQADAIGREIEVMENSQLRRLRQSLYETTGEINRVMFVYSAGAALYLLFLVAAFLFLRKRMRHRHDLMLQLEQSTRDISLSNQFISSLQSCGTRKEAGQVIRHYLQLLFPSTKGALYIMRASRNMLEVGATWGQSESADELMELLQTEDCWGLRLGKTHSVRNLASDLMCNHITGSPDAGYICVPMMAQSEIIGMLHLELTGTEDSEQIIDFAENVGAQMATALANLALREALRIQNIRDPLTNLYNRRYLEETMERELLLAQRNKSSIGIIMIDIDHFKNFNDNNGHQAGDELLKVFADYLRRHIRGGDIVCRYGGEEFVIVLPGSSLEKTRERAEELRLGMHDIHLDMRGQKLPAITGSFGVSAYPLHGDTWEQTLHIADLALYQAKHEGRDRVIMTDQHIKQAVPN